MGGAYSDLGIQAPDVVEMLIDFEHRLVANIHLNLFQRPRQRLTELVGTGGWITVEFARWDRCTVSLYEAATGDSILDGFETDRDSMFRAEDREFLEAVSGDSPIRCSIAEARKSLEAVFRAQKDSVSSKA